MLAPHGSICVELGDTYSGNGGENHLWDDGYSGGRKGNNTKKPVGAGRVRDTSRGWPLDKSLAGIPTLYAWSLAYGRNLLRPEHTIDPWRIRNLLVWARPNPPVGALGDKWRPATSYVTVACVGRSRYFDLDAVRTEPSIDPSAMAARGPKSVAARVAVGLDTGHVRGGGNPAGAPPLDWCDERDVAWQPLMPLATQPYAGSHYATFPTQLPKRLIECMSPQRVCTVCGTPSTRIVDVESHGEWRRPELEHTKANHGGPGTHGDRCRQATTIGWSDCGHDAWRPGHILDPFGGSGTTAVAATGLGRDCTLIDLDARNADLARDRVGMFLEVSS